MTVPSCMSISPLPISAKAICARGAKSPLEPTEPCDGTAGIRSCANIAINVSTVLIRIPEHPLASALILRIIMPLTICLSR